MATNALYVLFSLLLFTGLLRLFQLRGSIINIVVLTISLLATFLTLTFLGNEGSNSTFQLEVFLVCLTATLGIFSFVVAISYLITHAKLKRKNFSLELGKGISLNQLAIAHRRSNLGTLLGTLLVLHWYHQFIFFTFFCAFLESFYLFKNSALSNTKFHVVGVIIVWIVYGALSA